ncbi:unnamed protein product [Umbelopsis sp. WA50703]
MSDQLPPSILRRIFEFLPPAQVARCALTCRHWALPALKVIWNHLKFVRSRDFDRVFAVIARRNTLFSYGTFVKSVEIVHAERELAINPQMILLVVTLCNELEAISLNFSSVRAMPKLDQQSVQQKKALPPPQMIAHRPQPKPTVAVDTHTPPLPLAHIGHNCPSIHTLRLDSYSPKNDDTLYELAKCLTHGSLRNVRFTGCTTLQGSTLRKLAKTNPQMRHIEILGNTSVTDTTAVTLAEECGHHLQYLVLGNAYHLTDKSFNHFARYCHKLHHLSLYNINADSESLTENSFIQIINNCTELQVLNVSNARWLGEPFFNKVLDLVTNQLQSIETSNPISPSDTFGLQQICLGNVKPQVLKSSALRKLIALSSYANDEEPSEDEEDEQPPAFNVNQTSFMSPEPIPAKARKMNVVRGNSFWWYRRKPRPQQGN